MERCQYFMGHRCELGLLHSHRIEIKTRLGCYGDSPPACPSYKPQKRLLTHRERKERTWELLLSKGFSPAEIKVEYTVVVPVKLKVDMVGIKLGKKVAIECGYHVPKLERDQLLQKVFDEVTRL